MHSSATTAFRAFLMLACAVAIPVLAMSGASWSEIVKKFQNLKCPAILDLASASTAAPSPPGEAPRLASRGPSVASQPAPIAAPALPGAAAETAGSSAVPVRCREIQERLQELGATYYVLESWGNDRQLYRFYCKMAVAGNADYVHCFEATNSNPLQAMQQVLQQVETWRGGQQYGG
jgi:hypothetical protein